jgi:hypothetical protein
VLVAGRWVEADHSHMSCSSSDRLVCSFVQPVERVEREARPLPSRFPRVNRELQLQLPKPVFTQRCLGYIGRAPADPRPRTKAACRSACLYR